MKILQMDRHTDKIGKELTLTFAQLARKMETPVRTDETMEDFLGMTRTRQTAIKDVGGFIGGQFKNNRRTKAGMIRRDLLTVDIDYAPADFPQHIEALPFSYIIYTTHKHQPETPRYRLVMPFVEPVTSPALYEECARAFCEEYLDPEWVDKVSYNPAQIMFWPSVARDGVYEVYSRTDGEALNQGTLRIDPANVVPRIEKPQDPLARDDIAGLFCRAYYPITDAIENLLPDVYTPSSMPGRYTYADGHTPNGLVVYPEQTHVFSWHDTDPAGATDKSGKRHARNAYQLVCIHKFGGDDGQMLKFIDQDERCQQLWLKEKSEEVLQDFQPVDGKKPEMDWMLQLEKQEKTGDVLPSLHNFQIILRHDPNISEAIGGINEFSWRHEKTGALPWWDFVPWKSEWTDTDDSGLLAYLEKMYGVYHEKKTQRALANVAYENRFHPIREKLEGLEWDELERVEEFFINYFGAEDNEYTRAVTRKMFAAAVKRIFEPGCKFDYVVVMVGAQGIGKSLTVQKLAYNKWFTDLVTFKGKEAVEGIQGSWLIEIGEMTALRKSEADEQKQFITRPADKQRMAYARNTEWFPRQCIFIGSINEGAFLKDMTGNRRWWPIDCDVDRRSLDPTKGLDESEVDQIWAEAVQIYRKGEELYLSPELEALAREVQESHREISFEESQVYEFLDRRIPDNWLETDPQFRADEFESGRPMMERQFVSAIEVWEIGLKRDRRDFRTSDQRRIASYIEKAGWQRDKKQSRLDPHYGVQRYFRRKKRCNRV